MLLNHQFLSIKKKYIYFYTNLKSIYETIAITMASYREHCSRSVKIALYGRQWKYLTSLNVPSVPDG